MDKVSRIVYYEIWQFRYMIVNSKCIDSSKYSYTTEHSTAPRQMAEKSLQLESEIRMSLSEILQLLHLISIIDPLI